MNPQARDGLRTRKLMNDQARPTRDPLHLFVGRDAELAELSAGIDDAIAGRGRLFLISGEPGAGKTTLAEQLANHAASRGVRVLWGRCWEGGGAPAYWPWVQLLRPLIEHRPEAAPEGPATGDVDISRLFPELLNGAATGVDLSPRSAAARFRLFAAVASLLKRESSVQPLLMILDDMHAADQASLLLLKFVVRDLRDARLLMVTTFRDLEALSDAEVTGTVGELLREGPSIRLRGLQPTEVRQFVANLTGRGVSDEQISRLDEATGGNPLFIREMVRLVGANGRPGWPGGAEISAGLRAVIHQRLSGLDANAIQVLSIAAVVGHEFEVPLVQQASTLDLPSILQSLAQAERSGIIVRAPGASSLFQFSHGLVREVLHDDLPVALRRELHAKVGEALEKLHEGELSPFVAQIAYHYAEAGTEDAAPEAIEYARRAGEQAMEAHAYEEAAAQYTRALEAMLLSASDDALRCDLLLRLGDAQARAGDYQAARGSFLRASELARRLDAPEQLARAALGFGEPQVEGGLVDQKLLTLLREALDRLSPEDSTLRARVLARLSLELTFSDDPKLRNELRDSLSREALEMSRRLGDASTLALACRARWMSVWGPDGLEERSALSDEIISLARQAGDRETELIGRARRITCALEAGDLRAADIDIAAHAQLAGQLRMPYYEWTAATLRAGRALLDGSIELAEGLAAAAQSLLAGRPNARLAYLNQITPIRWEQGRLAELRDAWSGLVDRFPQAGFGRAWLALTESERGRDDDAMGHVRALVEEVGDLPRGGLWLPSLASASLAIAQTGDPGAAAVVYPLLRPYSSRIIIIPMPHPVMCFGSASLYLALLANVMSRWEEATELFESAIRANIHLGAKALLARTQLEYARMLIRRGDTADRQKALPLLAASGATARDLGLATIGREAGHLQAPEAGGAVAPAHDVAAAVRDATDRNLFQQEGDYRTISYDGSVVRLRDSKGLRLLARMLAEPGREFHSIELESRENLSAPPALGSAHRAASLELESRPDLGDAGGLLGATAKAEYRARLQEIEAEIDEAEEWADPERASKAREERDFLVSELSRAVGLGGRDRKAGSHAERARINVTRAIKAAIDNVERNHASLGKHLRRTVRTGTYCSYNPDPRVPVNWQL